jgi:hypothetical protein
MVLISWRVPGSTVGEDEELDATGALDVVVVSSDGVVVAVPIVEVVIDAETLGRTEAELELGMERT